MTDFAVDRVSWYLNVKGTTETLEVVRLRFAALVNFLQENDLTRRPLIENKDAINEDFEISSSDVTEEGLLVLKKAHAKWLAGIDKGKSPTDVKVLIKELNNIRK